MGQRIFKTHNLYSVIHLKDGTALQFSGDTLVLDEDKHADAIAELDKIANRSAIYTPESGLETSPQALAEAQLAGQLAVSSAQAALGEANDTAKMLGQPQQQSTLNAGSAAEAAAKILAASKVAAAQ